MGKFREFFKDLSSFAQNAEKLTTYSEDYDKFSNELKDLEETSADYKKTRDDFNRTLVSLNTSIAELNNHISSLDGSFSKVNEKLGNLESTVAKQTASLDNISVSLQLELYQSLRALRNRYVNRAPHGWATDAEKKVARDFYDKIHLLGQDGESEALWADIEALPSSRTVY